MEAKEFGSYLRSLRKNKGLTIRQLELYSGVSNAYLSQIENGKRDIPSPEILQKISKPLGVEYEELMQRAGYIKGSIWHTTGSGKTETIQNLIKKTDKFIEIHSKDKLSESFVKIPIYGVIRAGYDMVAEQNIIGYDIVSRDQVIDGEYFYLVVKGDSMIEEGIKEGSRVLVRRQNYVDNGKIGVVLINGDEATLKRVFYEGENVVLQSSNRNIPPRILPAGDVRIQGQVKSYTVDV